MDTTPRGTVIRFGETSDRIADSRRIGEQIESSLGGNLLATLGDESGLLRFETARESDDLVGGGELKIEVGRNRFLQPLDVAVLHVATVLTKMGGDAVRARRFADRDCFDGIGLIASTSLTKRRNMVNIDVQPLLLQAHLRRPIWKAFTVENRLANWKALPVMIFVAACASAPRTNPGSTTPGPVNSGGTTGAAAPRLAVTQFLDAARAGDLQAMSVVFGTDRGAARDNIQWNELEKREIILQCFFNADSYRIVSETAGADSHRVVRAALTKGTVTRQPNFFVIQGPEGRWYVDNMEIAAVRDFCGQPPPN